MAPKTQGTSGPPPFGFVRSKAGVLEPHPTEAPIRRLAVELFVEHKRLRTVARLLTERGHRTRSGAKFTDTVLRRLVSDPAPGVIAPDLWERCQQVLAQREEESPARRAVHLFVGFSYCACGMKLQVSSSSPLAYACPQCRLRVPRDILEDAFRGQLPAFTISDDEARDLLAVSPERLRELELLVRSSESRLAAVHAELAGHQAAGGSPRKASDLRDQEAALLRSIESSKSEMALADMEGDVSPGVGDLYARWPELGGDEKRRIVEALLIRIIVSEGTIRMQLVELPPSPKEKPVSDRPVAPVQQVAPEAESREEASNRTRVKVKVSGDRKRVKREDPVPPPSKTRQPVPPVVPAEPSPPGEHLLTQAQVKELIPVSDMTLWRWVKTKKFPKPLRHNGRKYWRVKDVRAWMDAKAADEGS